MSIKAIEAKGEASIDAFLARADELGAVISGCFPATSLDSVHAKFAAVPIPTDKKGALNPEVVKLYTLVRQHAAVAVDELRNAEMWLYVKSPSVSDGNNFGVGACGPRARPAYWFPSTTNMRIRVLVRFRRAELCADRGAGDADKSAGDGRGSEHIPLAARCGEYLSKALTLADTLQASIPIRQHAHTLCLALFLPKALASRRRPAEKRQTLLRRRAPRRVPKAQTPRRRPRKAPRLPRLRRPRFALYAVALGASG